MQANIQIASALELRDIPELPRINTNTPAIFAASILNYTREVFAASIDNFAQSCILGFIEQVAKSLRYNIDELSKQSYSLLSRSNVTVSDAHMDLIMRKLTEQVLGRKAADRFSELKKISRGWNFGKGEPMTEGAQRNLLALLLHLTNPPPDPRLFLLSDGSLELRWKLSDERRVSIISTPVGFEVFDSNLDEEMTCADYDVEGILKAVGLESSARA